MVEMLEEGLLNYARVLQTLTGENVAQVAGGGAAGGMGIAAVIFLQANLKPCIEIVLQAVKLEQSIKDAALVITGEGRIDSQTVGGKAPIGVASVAMQHHVPVIGIAGVLGKAWRWSMTMVLMRYSVFCRGSPRWRKCWRAAKPISITARAISLVR